MSVEEAKSEVVSSEDLEDDEQYETITISEAPLDEDRYDQDIDMFEENQAMENFKGYCNYIHNVIVNYRFSNNFLKYRSKSGRAISR